MARQPVRASRKRLAWVTTLCLFAALLATRLGAQPPAASPVSRAARDRLYKELAREVDALEQQGNVLKKVVRLVKPTVAHIEVEKTDGSEIIYRRRPVEEAGSGVIVEFDGKFYVITNRHVILDADQSKIAIHLADGQLVHPSAVLEDKGTDIAVLEVETKGLTPARLGDSSTVEIGDFVLAVGSPFGLSHSVTYGIISAKGRRDLQLGVEGVRFQDFIQTDAAINPGNSGGPLLNLRGEVIGINTAIASSGGGNEGIGFTIPINMVMVVTNQLIQRGKVERAFLGVQLDAEFDAETAVRLGLPRAGGARVSGITPDSPAATAGFLPEDVIIKFDGVLIEDDNHLINQVSLTPVGKKVAIDLYRGGKPMTLTVQVAKRDQFRTD